MIQLSPELRAALESTANQPVDLYELHLESQVHYFADRAISWGGHDYLPYVLSRSSIRRYDGGQFDQVQVTLSNVDTSIAQLLLEGGIEGRRLVIRKVDVTVPGDSLVLFNGVMDRPSDIDEETASITAVQLLGSLDHEVPSRRFTTFCPWRFKSYECGYAGGESECNKSWARCSELGNTNRFGGFRFVPHSGSFQYQEVERKRFMLLFSRKKTVTKTATFNAVDDTPYEVPIPLVLGRAQIAGIPIQYVDEGGETKILAALAAGSCSNITYIRANGHLVASATGHLGQLGGTGSQLVDPRFPQGYPYNLLCYVGVTVPSDVREEDPAPVIDCVLLGALADFYDTSGQWTGFGWTDNPVWLTIWFLRLSLAQGGMGFPESWIDFGVCAETAAYCDELIPDTTNDQKIFSPPSLPGSMVVGDDYQRFQSTGVDGQDPLIGGPYEDYVPGVNDDTNVSPAMVMVKRFTMNGVIGRAEKAVDVLFKKLLPAFRGYITFSKDGKLQIRTERPVANTAIAAPSVSGATQIAVGDSGGFAVGNLVLVGALTAAAEVCQVSQVESGVLHFAVPLEEAHAAGEQIHLIHRACDDSNTIGKIAYPLSDRQASTNRVTVKYVDAPAGFETREVWVNDYEHQAQVNRVNNEEVDGAMIDSYFQAWRIGQWARAKARDLGRFVSLRSNIGASPLEIGDIITVSSSEHGLKNVPFRVIEIGFEPDDEVTITGQLYALGIYDDSAPQATVGVPGVFRPLLPGQQPEIGPVTNLQAPFQIEDGRVLIDFQGTAPEHSIFAGCYAFIEIPAEADPDPENPTYPGQLYPQNWHFGEPSEPGNPRIWQALLDVPVPPREYLESLDTPKVTWTLYALSRTWGYSNVFVRHTDENLPANHTPSIRITLDFTAYLDGIETEGLGQVTVTEAVPIRTWLPSGDLRLQALRADFRGYAPPYVGSSAAPAVDPDFQGVSLFWEPHEDPKRPYSAGQSPYTGDPLQTPPANLGEVDVIIPRGFLREGTNYLHLASFGESRRLPYRDHTRASIRTYWQITISSAELEATPSTGVAANPPSNVGQRVMILGPETWALVVFWTPPSPLGSTVGYDYELAYGAQSTPPGESGTWVPLGDVYGGSVREATAGAPPSEPFFRDAADVYAWSRARAYNERGERGEWVYSQASSLVPKVGRPAPSEVGACSLAITSPPGHPEAYQLVLSVTSPAPSNGIVAWQAGVEFHEKADGTAPEEGGQRLFPDKIPIDQAGWTWGAWPRPVPGYKVYARALVRFFYADGGMTDWIRSATPLPQIEQAPPPPSLFANTSFADYGDIDGVPSYWFGKRAEFADEKDWAGVNWIEVSARPFLDSGRTQPDDGWIDLGGLDPRGEYDETEEVWISQQLTSPFKREAYPTWWTLRMVPMNADGSPGTAIDVGPLHVPASEGFDASHLRLGSLASVFKIDPVTNKLDLRLDSQSLVVDGSNNLTTAAAGILDKLSIGEQFTKAAGFLGVNSIAVNYLAAGTALFNNTVVFQRATSNSAVTIDSNGVVLTSPGHSMALTSTELNIQAGGAALRMSANWVRASSMLAQTFEIRASMDATSNAVQLNTGTSYFAGAGVNFNCPVQFNGTVSGLTFSMISGSLPAHLHSQSEVNGLADALATKAAVSHSHDGVYSPVSHTHSGVYAPAEYYPSQSVNLELYSLNQRYEALEARVAALE